MAVATYTGDADQLFKVINQIKEKTKELQKLNNQLQFDAKLAPGSMTGLRTNVAKAAEIISKSVSISVNVKAANIAATVRSVREAFSKSIQAKVSPYVTNASIKTVKDRIKAVIAGSYAEVGLRFQAGAAAKFRQTLRSMLAVLSRGSYIDAQLRIKGTTQTLNALKNKKVTIDVDVKAGTAAKIKALLELLKQVKQGVKVPIKLEIDSGLHILLRSLVKDLKTAADQAARLNARLGGTAGGLGRVNAEASVMSPLLGRVREAFVALGVGTIIFQGIHGAFAVLKEALFQFPAVLQQVQIGFEGMFDGSKEKADELMKSLKAFAIPTPFEMIDLAPMAQQALAFDLVDKKSKQAAKETIDLLTDVGDAAFGLGRGQAGVDRLMLAFGQMKTATRVMGQEMLQIQQLGVNGWKYLAEATGKTTREVRDLVSKGLIPADQAIKAIREGLRRDFGGAMIRASKTALGAIAQIRDSLNVRLSEGFSRQFQQISDTLVKIADYTGSADFGTKLAQGATIAQNAIDKLGDAWQFLTDLYRNNSGVIDAALLALGSRLIWLGMVTKTNPLVALLGFAQATQLMAQRTDGYGRMAQALTPVLYALAAAYVAVKVAAAQAAIAQGVQAGITGATSGLTGLAAASARVVTAFTALSRVVSIFRFISASAGPMAAVQSILASLTASVSGLALVALPVLAAALGVAAIGYEKYQEKAARVDAANAGLSDSMRDVEAAFKSLGEISAITPGGVDAINQLTEAYRALDGSVASLQKFKSLDLAKAQGSIVLNTKLKPLEKQVLLDEIARLEKQVNDQLEAAQFKAQVEIEANPTSLANITEAFVQTYGVTSDQMKRNAQHNGEDFVKIWKWVCDRIQGLTTNLNFDLNSRWYALTGGFESGFNRMIRRIADSITGLMGTLLSSIQQSWAHFKAWFAGQSPDGTDGPELPGFGADYNADQKRRNVAWRKSHAAPLVPAGPPAYSPSILANTPDRRAAAGLAPLPVPGPYSPSIALDTPAKRRAALLASQSLAEAGITHFDPSADAKKKGKTEAEKAAEREKRAALKLEKDALMDTAKAYDAQAKAAEDSAKSQIEALTGLRDTFRDVFSSIQELFVSLGLIDNPLGPLIENFERLLDVGGKSEKIVSAARKQVEGLRGLANNARSRQEILSGLDGSVPGGTGVSSLDKSGGGSVRAPSWLLAMEDNAGRSFGRNCAEEIKARLKGFGIASVGSLRSASQNQALRVGFDANGRLPAGTIVRYPPHMAGRGRVGDRYGHYAAIGSNQRTWTESNVVSKDTISTSRVIDWARLQRDVAAGRALAYAPRGAVRATGTRKLDSFLGRDALKNGENPFDLSGIDGTLSKIAKVDKAWGAAVRSTEGTTVRFMLQSKLATTEFQSQLEIAAQKTGKTVPEIIKWLRELGNQADAQINHAKAIQAITDSIRDLQKQTRAVGQDKNPLAGILEEFNAGGKFASAPEKKIPLLDAQMALNLAQIAQSTKEATQAERDRIAAMNEALPYLNKATAGTDAYELALERSNRKFEIWRDTQIQGLLLAATTYDKLGGAALTAASQLERAAKALRASGLGVLGIGLDEEAARKRAQGQGLKGRAAGLRARANATANTRIRVANEAAEYGRAVGRTQENLQTNFELDNRIKLAEKERDILRDTSLTEDQRAAKIERENFIFEEQIRLMGLHHTQQRALELATERADKRDQAGGITRSNDALREYNSLQAEAARDAATFGDLTGLAGLKYEQSKGKLKGLTDAQKAQMLVNQATILGLQRYGQEFDSLFGQKYALAAENLERQMSLTQGLSALQKQELQWQQQDAEQAARNKDLTDEQREAYEQQRKKVLALRNEVRKLLADQKRLAAEEWLKGSQRSFDLMKEQDDIKRARMDLENQLVDSGNFGPEKEDPMTKAILDVNEFQLRAEQSLSHIKDYVSQVQNVFGQGFDQAFEKGPRGFFEGVIKGFGDMIQNISTQILSAALTKMFVKAFPQVGGYFDQAANSVNELTASTVASAFAATGAAAAYSAQTAALTALTAAAIAYQAVTGQPIPNAPSSGGGKEGSAGATSAAIGERYVPYDGALYRLHRGESVLTRRETELRNSLAAAPSSYGSGGSNGVIRGGDTINIANVNMPPGTDAKNFVSRTKSEIAPRLSRRSQQNLAYDRVSPGGRQR